MFDNLTKTAERDEQLIDRGELKRCKKIIINLHRKGLDDHTIAEYTMCTIEYVCSVIEEYKNSIKSGVSYSEDSI